MDHYCSWRNWGGSSQSVLYYKNLIKLWNNLWCSRLTWETPTTLTNASNLSHGVTVVTNFILFNRYKISLSKLLEANLLDSVTLRKYSIILDSFSINDRNGIYNAIMKNLTGWVRKNNYAASAAHTVMNKSMPSSFFIYLFSSAKQQREITTFTALMTTLAYNHTSKILCLI